MISRRSLQGKHRWAWVSVLQQHKGNEMASLQQGEKERILNTISRGYLGTICADKKTFIAYSAFGWILWPVVLQWNERLESDTWVSAVCVHFAVQWHVCCNRCIWIVNTAQIIIQKNKQPVTEASWVRDILSGAYFRNENTPRRENTYEQIFIFVFIIWKTTKKRNILSFIFCVS